MTPYSHNRLKVKANKNKTIFNIPNVFIIQHIYQVLHLVISKTQKLTESRREVDTAELRT